jgi:hypothetical protein
MKCNSTCLEVLNADILVHGETSRKMFAFFFFCCECTGCKYINKYLNTGNNMTWPFTADE